MNDRPPLRVMARLDVKGPHAIKGIHMEGLRIVGAPAALARRYYEQGADEVVYIDLVASLYGRGLDLAAIERVAAEIFVPLTVGGGIRTIDDIVAALRRGADKAAINTAALARPQLIAEAAQAFGSQCIVASIEAKRRPGGGWTALANGGRESTGVDAVAWAAECERLGAGEILLTSIDRDGTFRGFDGELIAAVRGAVKVPVIASGGAGTPGHAVELVAATGVEALCCAAMLHFGRATLPELKAALARGGVAVRA